MISPRPHNLPKLKQSKIHPVGPVPWDSRPRLGPIHRELPTLDGLKLLSKVGSVPWDSRVRSTGNSQP